MNRCSDFKWKSWLKRHSIVPPLLKCVQNLYFTTTMKRKPPFLFTLSFSCAYQFWCVFIVAFIFHEITLIILLQFGAINFISNWQRQLLRCVIMIKHNLSTWSSTINSRSPRFGDREMRWTRCGPNGLMEPLCAASIPIGVRVYLIGRRHTSHKMSHARLLLIWRGRCLRAYNSALEKLDERQNV